MKRLLPVLVLLGACSDAGVTKFNTDPTAEISSHASGDTVREGYLETLRGSVGDANHGVEPLTVAWVVDGVDVCLDAVPAADGLVTCAHTFLPTGGEVLLEVRDPEGGSGSARVTVGVQPTDAPVASIRAPTTSGIYYSDALTTLEGQVSDPDEDAAGLSVEWESTLDGILVGGFDTPDSEGGLLGAVTLEEGEHFLTLTVTDSTGKEGRDSVTFQVGPPNSPPSCEITAPEDGSAGSEGEEVRFAATVSDPDVPADWLLVDWTSDKDDLLGASTANTDGTVGFAYSDLSINTHSITLTVTDEIGATCTDSIFYSVGTPPVLTVTAPADGDVFNETEPVQFTGTALDDEDLETDIALSWESDVDGEFATDGADSDGDIDFSAALTAGPHTITVRATDTDDLYDQTTFSITVNQVPTQPTVTIDPDPARTDDTLTAGATGATDPDASGTVTYSYAWYEDGILSSVSTTATFPASDTQKNSTYRVVVTPSDGTGDGPTGEAERTIDNTDPVLSGPSLSASTVVVGDSLTCSASATDADGDTVTLTYAWSDSSTGPTYLVTETDDPGDTITCTATADDSDGGVVTGTASATVDNTDPVIDRIEVDPTTGKVGDTLTCTATATDDDGGTPTITYAWSTGETGATYTIVASDDPGDVITCTATATDVDLGTDTDSASATVDNTDPEIDSISVTPSTAKVGEDLTCAATASDADGGSPTISYAWSTGETGDTYTIQVSDDPGDTITCTATATDVDLGTGTGTASATVENTAPEVDSVSITPSSGTVGETLVCVATASDEDGETPTLTYAWSTGETGDTYTIQASDDPGDVITCTATARDLALATGTGTATATVDNSDPEIISITVNPSSGPVGQVLTCAAIASDLDGETPTLTYAWSNGDTGATTTIAASDDPGDTITCTATATDVDLGTGTGTASATVDNTDPEIDSVSVSPSSAKVGEDLTCSATASDADGGSPTITYVWSTGDTGDTYTIAASDDPADTITCTATATDADLGTGTGTASATVDNTDPVIDSISVDPASGPVDAVLTCEAVASDADGDTPTITYVWSNGDTTAATTVSSSDTPGDTLTCTATARDPDGGEATDTASATVDNSDPEVDTVTITPATANNDDELTCAATASDPDGGTPTLTYAWSGSLSGSLGTGSTVDLSLTSAASAETITCTATATDAAGGTGTGTASRTLDNRSPTVSVSLAPDPALSTDTLTCTATTADLDDDTPTLTFTWTVGASSVSATTTAAASSTLSGAFSPSDTVTCMARADDGKGGVTTDSADVVIGNQAPTVSGVSLSSSVVYTNDILSVTATVSDPDGDSLTTTYDWYVESTLVQSGSSATLLGAVYFDRGEEVYVEVQTTDGMDSASASSSTVEVLNSAPGAPSLSIDPSAPEGGDTLTCEVSTGSADADSDSITYTMSWTVDGVAYTGSSTTTWTGDTIDGADVFGSEKWVCTALPSDGTDDGDSATVSVTVAAEPESLALADVVFMGENYGLYAGYEVASAGDVDGDGYDDVLIGTGNLVYGGTTYLFLASSIGTSGSIDVSTADYIFEGGGLERSGTALAGVGDVDGDGLDDILIGAWANSDINTSSGKAYLFLGKSLGATSTISLTSADYSFAGIDRNDFMGWSVAGVGDVDGDTYDDFLIGAYGHSGAAGRVSLYLGGSLGSTSDLGAADADHTWYSWAAYSGYEHLGYSVNTAGDIDGDGLPDLLLGAYSNDDMGTNAGSAYLELSSGVSYSSSYVVYSDYIFEGEAANDYAASEVTGVGDVDGDGLVDLLIGAPQNDDAANNAGRIYLMLGDGLSPGTTALADADTIFEGEAASDYAGVQIDGGDFDADGHADILMNATGNDEAANDAGKVYVFLGSGLASTSPIALATAPFSYLGENAVDNAGSEVVNAGDVDGDGRDDILIGAHNNDNPGTNAGQAYLLFSDF